MMIFDACFEQSTFSIHDEPTGCCFESSRPSCTNASTHLCASAGVLVLMYLTVESPTAFVIAAASCGFIQYTPGLFGSLVPYFSYVSLSTHQLSSFCTWIVSWMRPSIAFCCA